MKTLLKSLKITLAFSLLLAVVYVFVLWAFAQIVTPKKGNAEVLKLNGKIVGAANIGQSFTQDIYFWGRPSCAGNGYDAANSSGSNKAPTNPEYLKEVEKRIDNFLIHHPYLKRKDVPAEMVTASGSGLDPDITPACAYIQVKRIAKARNISEESIKKLIDATIERPFLGIFGTKKINVLKLNAALDKKECI